jgi:conjugative transfer signal peptidase TraF
MIQHLKRITNGIAIAACIVMTLAFIFWIAGARINITRSIPLGLYWASLSELEKGSYVVFCPSPAATFDEARKRKYISTGFCPGRYSYMMKRVFGVSGDVVSIADDGVRVNGTLLPLSLPREADLAGRAMPHYRLNDYRLDDSELLLMSDVSARSFDGRYFGLVKRAQIKDVVRPVWTW